MWPQWPLLLCGLLLSASAAAWNPDAGLVPPLGGAARTVSVSSHNVDTQNIIDGNDNTAWQSDGCARRGCWATPVGAHTSTTASSSCAVCALHAINWTSPQQCHGEVHPPPLATLPQVPAHWLHLPGGDQRAEGRLRHTRPLHRHSHVFRAGQCLRHQLLHRWAQRRPQRSWVWARAQAAHDPPVHCATQPAVRLAGKLASQSASGLRQPSITTAAVSRHGSLWLVAAMSAKHTRNCLPTTAVVHTPAACTPCVEHPPCMCVPRAGATIKAVQGLAFIRASLPAPRPVYQVYFRGNWGSGSSSGVARVRGDNGTPWTLLSGASPRLTAWRQSV